MTARIGIFGGTFDPIHFGHLILAERCRDLAKLDRVIFVPARQSPLKKDVPRISDGVRVELVQLAIAGHEAFEVSRYELDDSDSNFTVDSLRHFRQQFPDDQLFFLMGSDSLAEFSKWKQPETICELAQLLVIGRPGGPAVDFDSLAKILNREQLDSIRDHQLESPLVEISSTDIRNRIARGESIRYLMPRANEMLIKDRKLYQNVEKVKS